MLQHTIKKHKFGADLLTNKDEKIWTVLTQKVVKELINRICKREDILFMSKEEDYTLDINIKFLIFSFITKTRVK